MTPPLDDSGPPLRAKPPRKRDRTPSNPRKKIALALQGGGSHGAFTWGVLDRLLEDGRLDIEGVSGTSAGAMNTVALLDGLMRGGADGARRSLRSFWKAISEQAKFSPIKRAPLDVLMGNWTLDLSPGYFLFDAVNKFVSPYDANPLNLNPLKDLLQGVVDFDLVRSATSPAAFISCTNVETGRAKVFKRSEITPDVVMASACLPFLFQAVEIDGVPYWDGGYMGNPVLFPFHKETQTKDYVIVQINPVSRPGTPKTARDIVNRVNEISFNASLLQEVNAIGFVNRMLDQGKLDPARYKRIDLHVIAAHADIDPLGAASKLNAEWAFLEHLRDIGRNAAEAWLEKDFETLGQRSASTFCNKNERGSFTSKIRKYVGGLR